MNISENIDIEKVKEKKKNIIDESGNKNIILHVSACLSPPLRRDIT